MKPSVLYTIVITAVFLVLTGVFLLLPRSTYSELEKRDLATFPEFKPEKLKGAQYTGEVSHWFSDTEPFRDDFMSASMTVRDMLRVSFGKEEDAVTFHSTEEGAPTPKINGIENQADYQNTVTANENAKIATAGILIVGRAPNARALNAFGGNETGGTAFASVVSQYAKEMPNVNVYAMVIPLSSEFYMPDKAKGKSKPQLPFIKNIYSNLTNGAKGVNAYGALVDHITENVYLRTDHHWAPLGAHYAAKEFAKVAGVPFKDLSAYEKKVLHGFVGSMYGYSKDISVKNSPEDFIYYVPKGLNYKVTYRNYKVNANYQVISESQPQAGEFFYQYKDGQGLAYSTFMGGDQRLTHISTGTKNGRRLVLIKDSYGNAVPSNLFYSFEDIYVVDFRYFSHNIKKFVADNRVTDILFCTNVFNAFGSSAADKMKRFLTQGENSFASATVAPPMAQKQGSQTPVEKTADKAKPASTNISDKPAETQKSTEHVKEEQAPKTETVKASQIGEPE